MRGDAVYFHYRLSLFSARRVCCRRRRIQQLRRQRMEEAGGGMGRLLLWLLVMPLTVGRFNRCNVFRNVRALSLDEVCMGSRVVLTTADIHTSYSYA